MSDDLLKALKHVFEGTEVTVIAMDEEGTHVVCQPSPRIHDSLADRYPDWHLIDPASMQEIRVGETLRSADGEEWTLTGGRPPHNINSTGRVYVEDDEGAREFFPSVFDLKWFHKSEVRVDES